MKNIKTLTMLRGIMAIGIVLFHYNEFQGLSDEINLPFFNQFQFFYRNGGLYDELFFMLSGFFLYLINNTKISNDETTPKQFFLKRFIKLYPLYIITTIIMFIMMSIFYKRNSYFYSGTIINLESIILNILCLSRGYFNNDVYPFNGNAWFLNVIIIDYILFYIITKFIKKEKAKIITMIMLIILGITLKIFNISYPILNYSIGRGIFAFFIGCILSIIYKKFLINKKTNKLLLSLLLPLFILMLIFGDYYYILVLVIFPIILVYLTIIDKHIPNIKPLIWLGKISFSIFLWDNCLKLGLRIINIEIQFFSYPFFFFYFITLIIISSISYLLIEKKLTNFLKHKLNI